MKKNEKNEYGCYDYQSNNLLCDKQCYSPEAIIRKIKNTIISSLTCFLTIKLQSGVS